MNGPLPRGPADHEVSKPASPPGTPKGRRKYRLTPREQIWDDVEHETGAPLQIWMRRYAHWLVLQPSKKKRTEHERAATQFAGYPVRYNSLQRLRSRRDFQMYYRQILEDQAVLVREEIKQDAQFYLGAHRQALEGILESAKASEALTAIKGRIQGLALATTEKEALIREIALLEELYYNPQAFEKVAKFTVPILQVLIPKKVEESKTVTRVNITLGGASPHTQKLLADVSEEIPAVEYTIEGQERDE